MFRFESNHLVDHPTPRATLGNDTSTMKLNIPACAMYRQIGTVIVKTDDVECSRTCLQGGCNRTYACEQCSRTTTNIPYSDCDSDIVKRCRAYRSSAARSRYVNVCAAVCLLLLVGGLSPQSSASPFKMDDKPCYEQGRILWENPCNYNPEDNLPNGLPRATSAFDEHYPRRVANQAQSALHAAQEFKELFAKNMFGYDSFDSLLQTVVNEQWLRGPKFETFVGEYTLPAQKTKLGQFLTEDYVNKVVEEIDTALPALHKALKMVVAVMFDIRNRGLDLQLELELRLQDPFDAFMNRCRSTLCYMNELMASKKLEVLPLEDSELPDVRDGNRLVIVMTAYRDSMLFMEWLGQLMSNLARATAGP